MKEPKRWLDSDSTAAPDVRELLRHARPTRTPAQQTLLASAPAVKSAALAKSQAVSLSLGLRMLLGAVVISAAGAAVYKRATRPKPSESFLESSASQAEQAHRQPAAPPAKTEALEQAEASARAGPPVAAPAAKAAPTEVPAMERPPVRKRITSRSARASRPRRWVADHITAPNQASDPAADTLVVEARLLARARRNLDVRPQAALDRARQHEQAYPDGHLVVERELLIVDALMRLGRVKAARTRASGLSQRFPGHLYRERLRELMETVPEKSEGRLR
ncbi:MAG: hypothetical protein MJD61_03450 [Proteobacteria bacterium]|nr:hypothetical protein [Pseudomonadota bacterium]